MVFTSLSCSKDGGENLGNESIEVSIAEINAPASLNTQKIEIKANCDWELSLEDENGNVPTWITTDKTIGRGDYTVNLKIYANKFKNDRQAVLYVNSVKGQTSKSVVIRQEGDKSSDIEDSEITVKVGSYNLRISTMDGGDNDWSKRKERVRQSILENDFSFFGVQECDSRLQTDLKSLVGNIYECKFFSPYSQTGNGEKAQGLLYKKDEYELSDWKFFWPSANPDQMSTNDTGSEGNFSRGGCCGILTHKSSGVKIFIMVTHGCLNNESNNKCAPVYAEMEKKYNTKQYPSFFVGDMNAKPADFPSTEYRKHWKDTYLELTADKISGPTGTYNGFDLDKNMASAPRIDYIYCKGNAEPQKYICNANKYGGFYPSDHLPISSVFKVKSTGE